MSNQPTSPNKQDQIRNPQNQTQPGRKDQYSSNQNTGGQKNDPSSSRVGNNVEKDEPTARDRDQGGMKKELKGQDSRSSSSTDDKNQPPPRKSSNA